MANRRRSKKADVMRYADAPPATRGRLPRADDVVFELMLYPNEYARILIDEADRRGLRFPRGTIPKIWEVVRFIKGTLKKSLVRQGIK